MLGYLAPYLTTQNLGVIFVLVSRSKFSVEVAQRLIDFGVDIGYRGNELSPPLQLAAKGDSVAAAIYMKFLLRKGVSLWMPEFSRPFRSERAQRTWKRHLG